MTKFFIFLFAACLLSAATLPAGPVTTLVFSPDGQSLISNGHGQVRLHSLTDGKVQESFPCAVQRIHSLAFSPAGNLLAAVGGAPGVQGEFAMIDWATRRTIYHATIAADMNTQVAFSADGQLVATCSADHTATVYPLSKYGLPSKPVSLRGHTGPVLAIAFDPPTTNLITAGADRSLKVWSKEGALLRTMSYHTEAVNAIAFRPLGPGKRSECATGSDDGSMRVWQPEIGRMVRIVRGHSGSILALASHPDGSSFFTAGKEGIIRQIDGTSDTILGALRAEQDWIYALAMNPEGNLLASGDWKGAVKVWKLRKDRAASTWLLPDR